MRPLRSSGLIVPESTIGLAASIVGCILCALALSVLFGWAFHIVILMGLVPGLALMKANTATAFLLAGLALLRRNHRDHLLYALGVFLLGVLSLTEYLSRSDFGIDQLLFRDPYSTIFPGRMSQIATVGFMSLGSALAFMKSDSQRGRMFSRVLGGAAGAIGAIALLGYSYDTRALYQVQPYTSMALNTAIAFVVACIGVQCVNPAEGLVRRIHADNAGGAILRKLLPTALFIPYLLGFAAWTLHKRQGWETGFTLALLVAATMACLLLIMVFNAARLEREDLALRNANRALEERTASLEAQEELLKTFVSYVPAAVAMLDREMRYLQVSDRWCTDYSSSTSQVIGRCHYEIFPDLPDRWKKLHQRCLAGETLRAEEDRWDREDGTAIWVHWEIRPWGTRNGLPEGILIFSENITRRKQIEEELRELNRTLEDRVRERTSELADQISERERMQAVLDAQRAQMIAASKLTSLGEMAGGLAHEINSPLNIIQARASDLQETASAELMVESGTVLKATGSILRTSERIMSVVRGLRTFARDGRTDPTEKIPVQTILDDTLALCRERFAAYGVRVEVSSASTDLSIECQRVQISQILLNLLNNAFDAVQGFSERWVRIAVSDNGDNVSIAVTDSGRGIPREIAEKAMQPFFTTKPVGKGTGLGLSISTAIAEAHHGYLKIDQNDPNTRIVLSIPKIRPTAMGRPA